VCHSIEIGLLEHLIYWTPSLDSFYKYASKYEGEICDKCIYFFMPKKSSQNITCRHVQARILEIQDATLLTKLPSCFLFIMSNFKFVHLYIECSRHWTMNPPEVFEFFLSRMKWLRYAETAMGCGKFFLHLLTFASETITSKHIF